MLRIYSTEFCEIGNFKWSRTEMKNQLFKGRMNQLIIVLFSVDWSKEVNLHGHKNVAYLEILDKVPFRHEELCGKKGHEYN